MFKVKIRLWFNHNEDYIEAEYSGIKHENFQDAKLELESMADDYDLRCEAFIVNELEIERKGDSNDGNAE